MARRLFLTAAVMALTVWTSPMIKGQQSGTLVVNGATLIDGTGAGPVANSVIVIENGKITAIGPRARVRNPPGAQTIDATGKFVIPGLIDSHVHYRSWMGELFLNNGVTTVFDFGNDNDYIFPVRDAERSGTVKNIPRFFLVGAAIN